MQIEEVILRKLKMRLLHPFKTSFGTLQDKLFYVVEVVDREGNSGFGETVAFTHPWYSEETTATNRHMIEDILVPRLFEEPISHPDELSERFAPLRGNNMAKAALDGAIWDLHAKQRRMPLHALLGGTATEIDVGVSIGIQESVVELLEIIRRYVGEGYKRVKVKIQPQWDVEIIERIRDEFPDLPLMVDANSAYTLADLDHLQKLDAFRLLMIEQPLAHDDIVDHAVLQARMNTPICLDESIHSLSDVRQAFQLGSCRIINLKIGRVGGLTEARRIHDYCVENDIGLWCGGMLEAGIGRAHNIALSSLPGFTLPGDTAASARYWNEDIIVPEVEVDDGVIKVIKRPGIGYEVDRERLEKYTLETVRFRRGS